jgi:hypothetical protein
MTTSLGTTARTALPLAALALAASSVLAAPATAAPADTTSTTSAAPQLIDYATSTRHDVTVHVPSQVTRLRGAPADFKAFVARTARHLQAVDSCDAAAIGVSVVKIRTDGYAIGSIGDCGGYQALWAEVDGRWKEIFGTQDSLDCRVLVRYAVPSDIAGDTCYNYGRNRERPYHQA